MERAGRSEININYVNQAVDRLNCRGLSEAYYTIKEKIVGGLTREQSVDILKAALSSPDKINNRDTYLKYAHQKLSENHNLSTKDGFKNSKETEKLATAILQCENISLDMYDDKDPKTLKEAETYLNQLKDKALAFIEKKENHKIQSIIDAHRSVGLLSQEVSPEEVKAAVDKGVGSEKELLEFRNALNSKEPRSAGFATTTLRLLMGSPPNTAAQTNPQYTGIYQSGHRINKNRENLENYVTSDAFKEHQKSVRIYSAPGIGTKKAIKNATQRDPVNLRSQQRIEHGRDGKDVMKALFGYRSNALQEEVDTISESKRNNEPPSFIGPISVYSKTYFWNIPGSKSAPKEIGVLSTYAPALDDAGQPYSQHFIQGDIKPANNVLHEKHYREHMEAMASQIVQAAIDNSPPSGRLILPGIGQGAFTGLLDPNSKLVAQGIFDEEIAKAITANIDKLPSNFKIVVSTFTQPFVGEADDAFEERKKIMRRDNSTVNTLIKAGVKTEYADQDIKQTIQAGDLVVNAWDPASAPGNGNDGDPTIDGQLGRSTAILATQTNWLNQEMNNPKNHRNVPTKLGRETFFEKIVRIFAGG
jgi:hypothetical protein